MSDAFLSIYEEQRLLPKVPGRSGINAFCCYDKHGKSRKPIVIALSFIGLLSCLPIILFCNNDFLDRSLSSSMTMMKITKTGLIGTGTTMTNQYQASASSIPEDGDIHSHECRNGVAMGGDLQTTRGLLALTHSIIRNYNPNTSANTNTMHDNLCLFIFSTKEDLDEKKQSLECAVNSMENVDLSHVRIIHKIIDKQNWFPRVYSLSEADKLGMEYKWFRYYLSPNDVEGLNKILYLDTDMIIEGNIAELFEWDMNGHVVAATNYWEPLRNHLCHSHKLGDIAMKTDEIGFIGNAKTISPFETSNHINTGLLLIDLEMMLNQRILKNWSRLLDIHESEECLWLEEYSGEADFTLAINGGAEILPEEWNVGNLGSPEMYRLIGGCERANALHWNGAAKPYTNIGRTHALCLEYFIKYDVIPALLQSDPGCYNFQQLKK